MTLNTVMKSIIFTKFDKVKIQELLVIVNDFSVRKHLVSHPAFDEHNLQQWIHYKIEIDSKKGCCTRLVYIEDNLAGWCGIQPDEQGHELAIVLSPRYWGYGKQIFNILLSWSKEMGHSELVFNLLDTRPDYKALNKIATQMYKREIMGNTFTTYRITL